MTYLLDLPRDSLARDLGILLVWALAGIAVLVIASRYVFQRNHNRVSNLASVGRRVSTTEERDFDDFDIIIAGGGTAGCVLASRLTEDPSLRVLVLEAGQSGKALLWSRIPSAYALLYHTPHVYDLRTVPQLFAGGRTKFWPRAKLLGGCSSINAQIAHYGAPSDFDEWARIIDDESWAWRYFSKYIRRFENYTHDSRYPQVNAAHRGRGGPVRIGYFSTIAKTAEYFVQACTRIGIPFNPDFNTIAGTRGVNRIMTYIDRRGQRVSTESAYLTKDVLSRRNLKVVTHAQVTRILFEKIGDQIRAVGVEFSDTENGPRYHARARKEVIVSAGAIHSPHILMLSGVGPAEHLKQHGIPVVLDLPGVGSHLVDHPAIDLRFKDAVGLSRKFIKPASIPDALRMGVATLQYFATGRGPLASNLAESVAFFRTDDPILFPPTGGYSTKLEDTNSGPDSPDIEIITSPAAIENHEDIFLPRFHTFSMHVILLRPTSFGSVRLSSSSPWEHPSLDPNYCQTQHDVDALVRGIKIGLRIARTEPLASVLDQENDHPQLDHRLHLKSDDQLAEVVRDRVETLYHPSGSCRMAPLAEGGVVDSHQKVYGIANLRVCDVSTFPVLVSGHPTGACIASAERLADIMKSSARKQ